MKMLKKVDLSAKNEIRLSEFFLLWYIETPMTENRQTQENKRLRCLATV